MLPFLCPIHTRTARMCAESCCYLGLFAIGAAAERY